MKDTIKELMLILFLTLISFTGTSQSTTLYTNDFESLTTGYITSTNPSDPVWKYQWNAHSSCASTDIWRIGSSGGYGTNSSITGNYASVDYGSSSCVQDISFATQEFTATQTTINIEFDWAFQQYSGSYLKAVLYNEAGQSVQTLINVTSSGSGTYSGSVDVTANQKYSVDFRYYGTWDYGAKVDNILITEMAAGYEEATIGTGTANTSLIPSYGYYDYSWSGMIYTQSEIDKSGTLKTLSFYVDASSPASSTLTNQKIYVGHTTSSSFPSSPDEVLTSEISVSDYTLVYDGSVTFTPGWTTITLQQPFDYNNVNNLFVKMENRDGSYINPYPIFDYTSSTDRGAYKYADVTYPTGSGTRSSIRPNIKFLFQSTGSALPIELLSFDGSVVEDVRPYAVLDWEVASQINNDYYTIYHSIDGYEWNSISQVAGAGNSNTQMSYTLIHEEILPGWNYYKLRQTDYDGMFEEFNPISLKLKEDRKEIVSIYNQMGQEVDKYTKGFVILIWDNGDIEKTIIE
jgi:hypothetical protein